MARKFLNDQLVIASHNLGKVREMAKLVAPYDIAVTSAGDIGSNASD